MTTKSELEQYLDDNNDQYTILELCEWCQRDRSKDVEGDKQLLNWVKRMREEKVKMEREGEQK